MPAKSKAQQRLMAAAEHGASFAKAKQIRSSMSMKQMHDFASGSMKGKPGHVAKARHPRAGDTLPHANLGKYLHPKKGR